MKSKRKQIKYGAASVAVWLFGLVLLLFAVCKFCLLGTFNRQKAEGAERTTLYTTEDFSAVQHRRVEFLSGKNTLKGYVWESEESDRLVVISHGFGELSNYYYSVMEYFVNKGYSVLTYDNTGTGESDGLGTKGLSQSAIDLDNALKFIETDTQLKSKSVYLFGHSWGGHAVTSVLNTNNKRIKAVVSVAGYNSNSGAMLEWMQRRLNMGGFAYTLWPFTAFWAMVDAGENYYMTGVDGINASGVPVLVVQGGNDDTVLNDSIYAHRNEITNQSVEYYFVEDGTHTSLVISDNEKAEKYREQINTEYTELSKLYNGKIPAEAESRFIASIDKRLYNSVNTDTMEKACAFFDKA